MSETKWLAGKGIDWSKKPEPPAPEPPPPPVFNPFFGYWSIPVGDDELDDVSG